MRILSSLAALASMFFVSMVVAVGTASPSLAAGVCDSNPGVNDAYYGYCAQLSANRSLTTPVSGLSCDDGFVIVDGPNGRECVCSYSS